MREIKFRAWDKESKEFSFFDLINKDTFYFGDCIAGSFNNKQFILQQYTGLKDKNGKEIYEKDIVEYLEDYIQEDLIKKSIGVVKYNGSSFKIDSMESLEEWLEVEIIGNIYENPELLE